jgi:hypothetical protein
MEVNYNKVVYVFQEIVDALSVFKKYVYNSFRNYLVIDF